MREDEISELELRLLLEALHERYHCDFRGYASTSMRRRVALALSRFGMSTISQLQDRVLHDETMFPRLMQFLTVQVSDMFRDPTYWVALREHVMPVLHTWPSLKVWLAGVASGEELYSLSILLEEEGLLDRTLIYTTDVNREALRAAQNGIFLLDRLPGFTANYQRAGGARSFSEYYTAAYGHAAFSRRLVEHAVFSDHDLATDSAFSEVELVSCRNVLIYFTKPLQDRALRLFSESLVRGGFLCLGSKETLQFSPLAADYETVAAQQRIYRKSGQ